MVDFEPAVGAEITKVRPAVVDVPEAGRLPLHIVVPLTDWRPAFGQAPWFVRIPADRRNGLSKESGADAFQTKSLSVLRFVRELGEVTVAQIDDIAAAVAFVVGAS